MSGNEDDLIAQLPRVMNRVKRRLIAGHSFSVRGSLLTPTQIQILLTIKDNRSLTMTELHELTGLEKGSLTTVIDQLMEKGMIERRRDEADRRKVYVSLTDFGREQALVLHEDIIRFIGDKLEKLSPELRAEFFRAVSTFLKISERL